MSNLVMEVRYAFRSLYKSRTHAVDAGEANWWRHDSGRGDRVGDVGSGVIS